MGCVMLACGFDMSSFQRRFMEYQASMLDMLYETVVKPESWDGFLELLVDASCARSARLLFLNPSADRVLQSYKVNIDDSAHRDYVAHYVNTCPWRPELADKVDGRIYSTYRDFSCTQREFYKTEFYNDWARSLDIHHGACGTVFHGNGVKVQLLVQRTKTQGCFGDTETQLLNSLNPHLRRALFLSQQISGMRQELNARTQVAERTSLPFLMLDDIGQVTFVSAEAIRLIEGSDCLSLLRNHFSIEGQSVRGVLKQHGLYDGASSHQNSGYACLPIGRPGRSELWLICCALDPEIVGQQLMSGISRVVVFIHDPKCRVVVDRQLLTSLYGLTAAEARTAALAALGRDTIEIADSEGISVNTVRTQMKRCFQKTGSRRQSELASLVWATLMRTR